MRNPQIAWLRERCVFALRSSIFRAGRLAGLFQRPGLLLTHGQPRIKRSNKLFGRTALSSQNGRYRRIGKWIRSQSAVGLTSRRTPGSELSLQLNPAGHLVHIVWYSFVLQCEKSRRPRAGTFLIALSPRRAILFLFSPAKTLATSFD
jgi:hypothetical protein